MDTVRSAGVAYVAFDDDATRAMSLAFDRACISLRASGMATIVRELIAQRIVEVAVRGERDPARLHDQALKALGIEDASIMLAA